MKVEDLNLNEIIKSCSHINNLHWRNTILFISFFSFSSYVFINNGAWKTYTELTSTAYRVHVSSSLNFKQSSMISNGWILFLFYYFLKIKKKVKSSNSMNNKVHEQLFCFFFIMKYRNCDLTILQLFLVVGYTPFKCNVCNALCFFLYTLHIILGHIHYNLLSMTSHTPQFHFFLLFCCSFWNKKKTNSSQVVYSLFQSFSRQNIILL